VKIKRLFFVTKLLISGHIYWSYFDNRGRVFRLTLYVRRTTDGRCCRRISLVRSHG